MEAKLCGVGLLNREDHAWTERRITSNPTYRRLDMAAVGEKLPALAQDTFVGSCEVNQFEPLAEPPRH